MNSTVSPAAFTVLHRLQTRMHIHMPTLNSTHLSSLSSVTDLPLHPRILSLLLLSLLSSLLYQAYKLSQRTSSTPLPGPPSPSLLFGFYHHLNSPSPSAPDPGDIYESWSLTYGPAFRLPGGFGSSSVVICDPRANAHFYGRETFGYVQTRLGRVFIENLFGRGLLWAEGESHRRQRKALSPAFSNAAIRKLTPVFYDAAYKMKAIWDSTLDAASGEALIDVQTWMNHISLDSVGIAGFGHDFHALSPPAPPPSSPSSPSSPHTPSDSQPNPVTSAFASFGSGDTSPLSQLVFLLGPVFPILQNLPTKQNMIFRRLNVTMRGIADELLRRNRGEGKGEDKSIIGLLIKAEQTNSSLGMSQEEILAQNVLLLAGYETTSISLTWALIELSRQPSKQQKLREELSQPHFVGTDPTFDQLNTGLPYLDAVVHEVLRLHPPVSETTRVAAEDDIIPFSQPFTTASGEQLTQLVVKKGTVVTSPIRYMNRAEAFWGADGKEFVPERWLDGGVMGGTGGGGDKIGGDKGGGGGGDNGDEKEGNQARQARAKEIQGHKHILTFSDGPRTCLGKSFALAEFKAVLSVLIRNYTFELPDGPDTKIEKHPSILPRPKMAGEKGARVPLRVRRVE